MRGLTRLCFLYQHPSRVQFRICSLPSGSLATTTPAPPAPPNGAIPDLIEVKMARPFALAMTAGGILRITFFFRDPEASLSSFSSVMMPSTSSKINDHSIERRNLWCACLPVKALRILAHLSISLGKSPVTGQKASVPNLLSAKSFTFPPKLSETLTLLSIAYLPHMEPLALTLSFHVLAEGSGAKDEAEG